jgi:hypothetical protein
MATQECTSMDELINEEINEINSLNFQFEQLKWEMEKNIQQLRALQEVYGY